jgi:large subunit ribosomal protein L23
MKPFYEIIKKPLITEKAVFAKEAFGRYSFEVAMTASKPAILKAVEAFFQVKVKEVRTMIVHGKMRRIGRHQGRQANWKKAIVTLAEGQKIEMLEQK